MAPIFSDMSADGCWFVDAGFLILLPLLAEYFCCRPHQRGRTRRRLSWELDSFSSFHVGAADQSRAACNWHRMFLSVAEEDSTAAGESRALCRRQPVMSTLSVHEEDYAAFQGRASSSSHLAILNRSPTLSTLSVEEDYPAFQGRASSSCLVATFNRFLEMYKTATLSTAGVYTLVCRRQAGDIQLLTHEASGDNFHGALAWVKKSPVSRRRATANCHRMIAERPTYNDVEAEPRPSTFAGDRYGLSGNDYSSMLQFFRNVQQPEEVCRHRSQRISIDQDNLWWTVEGGLDFFLVGFVEQQNQWFWPDYLGRRDLPARFAERPIERLWRDYSSEGSLVEDDDSRDWRGQPCKDSTDELSGTTDQNSCHDQNNVCSDRHTEAHCSATSTVSGDFLLHRPTENDTMASSSTQLGSSGDDDANSSTEEEQDRSDDDGDDCDSSITTEPTQQDSNDEYADVSVAEEQATETSNVDDVTTSTPWWLIPGFRFLPTDKEIALHYLRPKVLGLELPEHHAVEEGDNIYALDADDIRLDGNDGDKERLGFFFVNKQDMAYSNGCYYTTPDGYWRIRGRPSPVRHRRRTIAFKTSMDFHRGRSPHGCRTPWSMFEYALNSDQSDLRNLAQPWMNSYVVCKVRKRERSSRPGRWQRRPRPLLPGRPSVKQISRRRIGPAESIAPDGIAPKQKEAVKDPEPVGDEPGVLGKRKRPATF